MLLWVLTFVTVSSGEACLACRVRKVRCDGSKPTCERCLRADTPCRYVGVAPRRRVTDALEARALELETRVADLAQTHHQVVLSDRIFDKIRSFIHEPPTVAIPSLNIPIFPWSSPQLTARRQVGRVVNEPMEEGYRPVIPRTTIEDMFTGWHPENGTSIAQSLYL